MTVNPGHLTVSYPTSKLEVSFDKLSTVKDTLSMGDCLIIDACQPTKKAVLGI